MELPGGGELSESESEDEFASNSETNGNSIFLSKEVNQGKKKLSCVVCGETKNTQFCSGCQSVVYCSISHQKSDWKSHKPICLASREFPLELIPYDAKEESNSGGIYSRKYPRATQDLKPGDVIVEELPLFSYITHMPDQEKKQSRRSSSRRRRNRKFTYCVTCGVSARIEISAQNPKKDNNKVGANFEKVYECEKCNWPVCSKSCAQNPIHADNECSVFSGTNLKHTSERFNNNEDFDDNQFWLMVAAARARNIAANKPKIWKEILEFIPKTDLSAHRNALMRIKVKMNEKKTSSSCLTSKFLLTSSADRKLLNDTFDHVTNISRHVGFSRPVGICDDVKNNWFHFLYKYASNFPHACAANCSFSIGQFPDARIRIRAAVSIEKGEPLYLNMLGSSIAFCGTWVRQKNFYQRFQSFCTCSLCCDPTELATNQSALICPNCYKAKEIESEDGKVSQCGYLIPEFPYTFAKKFGNEKKQQIRNQRDKTTIGNFEYWTCSTCSHVVSPARRIEIQEQILVRYESLLQLENGHLTTSIVEQLEKLQKERTFFLAQNHWLFQYGMSLYCKGRLRAARMNLRVNDNAYNMYAYLISILDVTCPGLQLERIRMLQHFGAEIVIRSAMPMAISNSSTLKMDTETLFNVLKTTQSYLNEACLFWSAHFSIVKEDNLAHCRHFKKLAEGLLDLIQPQECHFAKTEEVKEENEQEAHLAAIERELLLFSDAERE